MKKSFIYILSLVIGLSSCDPYKEINEFVNDDLALQRDNDEIPATYVISEDDHVFTTVEEAQDTIPSILLNNYRANQYTDGKLVEVSYTVQTLVDAPSFNDPYYVSEEDYLNANQGAVTVGIDLDESLTTIVLNNDDYAVTGDKYNNFGWYDDEAGEYPDGVQVDNVIDAKINDILRTNYPDEIVIGNKFTVEYAFYSNSTTTQQKRSYEIQEQQVDVDDAFINEVVAGSAMPSILDAMYADSEEGFVVMTSYSVIENYEEGTPEEELNKVLVHKAFEKEADGFDVYSGSPTLYMLFDEDYDAMGAPGRYNNFSSSVAPENYLPQFAASSMPYAQEGDQIQYLYKYYAGSELGTIIQSMTFEKGDSWMQIAPVLNSGAMDKFKYSFGTDGGVWLLSKAAEVTLTSADYALTGDDRYGNFGYYDNEPGEFPEGSGITVDNVIDAKIALILETNYSELNVADQEVTVYYEYYDNGTNTVSRTYIFDGTTSTWIKQ